MKMDKKLSASRGLRPADHQHGLCPWTPVGAPTQDPRYKLELRARHGPLPLAILDPLLLSANLSADLFGPTGSLLSIFSESTQ